MNTKPVLIIAPAEWNEEVVNNALEGGYVPVKGDKLYLTHILPDPNVYQANQRERIACAILPGLLANSSQFASGDCLSTAVTIALSLTDYLVLELNREPVKK